MTLGLFAWISVLGIPFFLGAGILRCLGLCSSSDRLAWPAWAWMTGTLATAAVLSLWLWLELPLDAGFIAPALLVPATLAHLLGRRRAVDPVDPIDPIDPIEMDRVPRASLGESALLGVVVAVTLVVCADRMIDANRQLLVRGDESNIWAGKAKILYEAGGFNAKLYEYAHPPIIASHVDYPPVNPLLHLWVFTHAGEVTHVDNRVPIQLFAPALLLALAAALRRQIRPSVAAALLLLVSSVRQFDFLSRWAYSDHLVALGLVVAFDAWLRFRATREDRWWGLMCIGLGFMAWSKNESLLIFVALLAGAGACRCLGGLRERPPAGRATWSPGRLAWTALPLLLIVVHQALNRAYGFENDLTEHGLFQLIGEQWSERFPIVCERLRELVLWSSFRPPELGAGDAAGALGNWSERSFPTNLLFAAVLLTLALFPLRIAKSAAAAPALMLLAASSGFFLVFVGSFHEIHWHMDTAIERVYFCLLPAAALWLALALSILVPALQPPSPPLARSTTGAYD